MSVWTQAVCSVAGELLHLILFVRGLRDVVVPFTKLVELCSLRDSTPCDLRVECVWSAWCACVFELIWKSLSCVVGSKLERGKQHVTCHAVSLTRTRRG